MVPFTWQPHYTFEEKIQYAINLIDYESGKETRQINQVEQRLWTLRWQLVEESTKDEILDFFIARSAGDRFYWTNPIDSVTYEVNFVEDTLSAKNTFHDFWDLEMQFVENLTPTGSLPEYVFGDTVAEFGSPGVYWDGVVR